MIQSLQNDDKTDIIIPSCNGDGLKMDNINNLYGDYWGFCLVGTVNGLADITEKQYCTAQKIALRKGCGYIARHNDGRGDDIFVRIYVAELVVNKDKEIIGATLLYESNYRQD